MIALEELLHTFIFGLLWP